MILTKKQKTKTGLPTGNQGIKDSFILKNIYHQQDYHGKIITTEISRQNST